MKMLFFVSRTLFLVALVGVVLWVGWRLVRRHLYGSSAGKLAERARALRAKRLENEIAAEENAVEHRALDVERMREDLDQLRERLGEEKFQRIMGEIDSMVASETVPATSAARSRADDGDDSVVLQSNTALTERN